MKVLVTGAGGRIGRMLVAALVERGHEVNCLELLQHPHVRALQQLGRNVRVFRGGLEHYAEVEPAVAGVDAVYHLGAAMGSFTDNQFFESNVRGTFNVLQGVRRVAPNLQRFVFPSSDAVYEKYIPGGLTMPIDPERTPRNGKGLYALTKSPAKRCVGATSVRLASRASSFASPSLAPRLSCRSSMSCGWTAC